MFKTYKITNKNNIFSNMKNKGYQSIKLVQQKQSIEDVEPEYSSKSKLLKFIALNDKVADLYSYDALCNELDLLSSSDSEDFPAPDSGYQCLSTNSTVILHGGVSKKNNNQLRDNKDVKGQTNYLLSYKDESESKNWSQVPINEDGPSPRSQHAAIMLEDKLLIFGGKDETTGQPLHDGWIYDTVEQLWVKLNYTNPEKSISGSGYTVISKGLCLYFFGSQLCSLQVLDLISLTWTTLELEESITSPDERSQYGISIFMNKIVIYGGIQASSGQILQDLWMLDLDEKAWELVLPGGCISSQCLPPRFGLQGLQVSGKLVFFGGYSSLESGLLDDVLIIDVEDSQTIQEVSSKQFISEIISGGLLTDSIYGDDQSDISFKKKASSVITAEEEEEKATLGSEEVKHQQSPENSKEQEFTMKNAGQPINVTKSKLVQEDITFISDERSRKSSPSQMLEQAQQLCQSLQGSLISESCDSLSQLLQCRCVVLHSFRRTLKQLQRGIWCLKCPARLERYKKIYAEKGFKIHDMILRKVLDIECKKGHQFKCNIRIIMKKKCPVCIRQEKKRIQAEMLLQEKIYQQKQAEIQKKLFQQARQSAQYIYFQQSRLQQQQRMPQQQQSQPQPPRGFFSHQSEVQSSQDTIRQLALSKAQQYNQMYQNDPSLTCTLQQVYCVYQVLLTPDNTYRETFSKQDSRQQQKSFRRMALRIHPDKNSHPCSSDAFQKINRIYREISIGK